MDAEQVQRLAIKEDVDLTDRTVEDRYTTISDVQKGDTLLSSPLRGELVTVEDVDEDAGELTLDYTERETLMASGRTVPHTRTISFDLFMNIAIHEGWLFIPMAVWKHTPRCPNCNRFMGQNRDSEGFPWAGCDRCEITVGFDRLTSDGNVVGILL